MNWPHLADIKRATEVVSGGAETFGAPATVHASEPCLIEGIAPYRQKTIFGDVSADRYQFSWGTQALREGDKVTNIRWASGVAIAAYAGKVFTLKPDIRDILRNPDETSIDPYQTGTMIEDL